ncbi:hypothetical protein A2V71_04610 [Candidatus Berkelbacteria bacterium RBG_13_40_8]|uniref:Uncharacterized protein n=1 Tax=Candidatus Berkelbacteria bacterium RBG_13_40_8 TaxID=1797467 RepID=A0A1F5DMQ7_9BACT|nr:MAG: hypothetical protein A2V71_04610 [Candidatus Berkelbacteria bacterium RBG_13_40_8]
MKKTIIIVFLVLLLIPIVTYAEDFPWANTLNSKTRVEFRPFNLQLAMMPVTPPKVVPSVSQLQLQLQLQPQTSVTFTPLTKLSLSSFSRTEWQNSLMRR